MPIVAKCGNSLAVRIPKNIARQIDLEVGMKIAIDVNEKNIVITPKKKEYILEDLLTGANSEDFESEYDWGEPVGEEIW